MRRLASLYRADLDMYMMNCKQTSQMTGTPICWWVLRIRRIRADRESSHPLILYQFRPRSLDVTRRDLQARIGKPGQVRW